MKTFNKRKVFQILRLLSKQELKSFETWLQSPWANKNKKLIKLFQFLKKFHPNFDATKLTSKLIFKKLYPDKKYNDGWLRNQLGHLSQQVALFLVFEKIKNQERLKKKFLTQVYLEKGKIEWLLQAMDNYVEHITEKEKALSPEDYLELFLLNEQLYYHSNTPFRQIRFAEPLFKANESLDRFYFLYKLRLANEFKERQEKLKGDFQIEGDISLLKNISVEWELPLFEFYQTRLHPKTTQYEKDLAGLTKKFKASLNNLSKKDQEILLFYLINDATRLFQNGRSNMLEEIYHLYQFGISQKILTYKGYLNETTYMNVITVGSSVMQFKFVQEFIEKFTPLLPLSSQTDAGKWATAQTNFLKMDYQKCIDTIKDYHFDTIGFDYRARVLILKSYYNILLQDISYYDLFVSYCKSFENQLRQNKRLYQKKWLGILRFVQYTKKLAIFHSNNQRKKVLINIKNDLNKEEEIQGKQWLENEIKILEERLSQKS